MMGRMSDLDITRQEYGLPISTPLDVLVALNKGEQLPMPVVAFNAEIERGDWMEATYDADARIDRLEDLEI